MPRPKGSHQTEEAKAKISASKTGVPASPERKAAISRGLTGRSLSEAHRLHLALAAERRWAAEKSRDAKPLKERRP
jgi:NUMOD3 motif